MRELKLYIAASLDGYIATREGSVDWLVDPDQKEGDGEDYGYQAFYDSIDTTLMGYNTYRKILDFGVPFPYPNKHNYVFSRNHTREGDYPVEFISSDIVDFTRNLKQQEGRHIWLIGGGQINRIMINADLIDEIILSLKLVVLGDGLPLFAGETLMKRFKIKDTRNYDKSLTQITMVRH